MKLGYQKTSLFIVVALAIVTVAPFQAVSAISSPSNPGNCSDSIKRKVVSRPSFYDSKDRKLSDAWVEVSVAGKNKYCIKAWTAGNGRKIVSVDTFNYERGSSSSPWAMTDGRGNDGDFGYYESRSYTASKDKSRKYAFVIRYNGKNYSTITPYLSVR